MTSSTDTAGHPDVAEISDLTEGLLPDSRTADVRRHLDGCELCADVHASLEEIRGLLGTAPGPTRMPADVAGRIDAALAAEALLQATAPDAVNAPAPVESAHVSRETSPTADRPSGHARSASTGPGRKERKKGSRRKTAVLGTAFAVAALGIGSVLLVSLNDNKASDQDQVSAADTFSDSNLEKQVSQLIRSAHGGSRSPQDEMGVATAPSDKQPNLTKKLSFIPACVQKGIPTQDTALATKDGVYKGKDALLVVLPDPSHSNRVTVFIMDASCVKTAPTSTAKILLKQSYARS
ncbi:anti-sigma factor family protein [Streptomyces griseorubiginosus]|uniref:anti-sigma factor family protein n=1 Tax=Streptomyces griseorubiginosus TaxID=67304 RepID=UPI0036EE452E